MTVQPIDPKQFEKLRRSDRRCVYIAGYWQNDRQGGLSLSCSTPEGEDDLGDLPELLDMAIIRVAGIDATKNEFIEFMTHMSQNKTTDIAEQIWILATIAYMEESGMLVSDEYNGIVYMYIENDGEATVERFDQ
jgi:hypothetical protein